MDRAGPVSPAATWRPLLNLGAGAAIAMLALIPIQLMVFVRYPPPVRAVDFLALFQSSRLLGLLSLDLIYLLDILLAGLLMLALCAALWRSSPSLVAVALFFTTIATVMYVPSNTAFEMLFLSGRYVVSEPGPEQTAVLGAAEAMLAIYRGTAFNVSYVLAAVAGLIVAVVMLRTRVFGRSTAYLGMTANTLGLVPPTAGLVGLVSSLLFLIPFVIWLVLIARRLVRFARVPAEQGDASDEMPRGMSSTSLAAGQSVNQRKELQT